MTGPPGEPKRTAALRALLVRGDDPYAGADMPSVRNAVGVLLLLHAALTVAFLPLAPPTTPAGWIVGVIVVVLSALGSAWALRAHSGVTFDRLLALAFVGLAAPVALELLSGKSVPYQLLFLVWVGCGAIHTTVRAVAFLATLALAALTPFLLRGVMGDLPEALAWTVLFIAVGLFLNGYVSHVRRQRLELRSGERRAQDLAQAATQRVRDLQWATDATLVHLPLEELLDELLRRIVQAMGQEHGSILLISDDGRHLVHASGCGPLANDL